MNKVFTVGLSILLGTAFQQAGAIAVSDLATAEIAPTNSGFSLNWDFVYKFRNSSSVAVDHYWILTAAHVADDGGSGTINIGGEIYTPQETVYHPMADLALVRFDKQFPGYYLIYDDEIYYETGFGRNKTTVYEELLMVGYGKTGAVTQTTFENGPGGNGIKRWGTNQGSGIEQQINATIGSSFSSYCFHMDFDLSDTSYEAGGAQYDSGSPVFIEDSEQWKIAGITAYLSGSAPNYNGNFSIKMADYRNWVLSVLLDYDTDMDGLPDHWELNTGETEPDLDPDEDGFSNYEEWICDTDPNLAHSFLQLMEYTNATSLVFSSSSNRTYAVDYCENLTIQNWQVETGWFSGSHSQTVQAVSTGSSNRFYRVRARLY